MTWIGLIIAYAVPLLIGQTAVTLAEGSERLFRRGERLAAGFALGLGIQTMYIFCLGLIGVRFTFLSCSAPAWPALLLNVFWLKTGRIRLVPGSITLLGKMRPAGKVFFSLLLGLLAVKLGFNLFISSSAPAYFDDSITIWNFKAKVFYHHRGIILDENHPDFLGGKVPKYPNGVPLFKTWIAICAGGWQEWAVNSLSPVIFLLTGIVLYYGLGRWLLPWLALIGSYLVMSFPLFAFHGAFAHADNYVGFYLMGGIIYLYRWLMEKKTAPVLVAAGFFATAGWIKDEGLILFLGGVSLPLLVYVILNPDRWKSALLLVGAVFLFLVAWLGAEMVFRFPVAVATGEYFRIEFHPEAFPLLKRFFLNTGNYNIFWIFYLISLPMAWPVRRHGRLMYLWGMNLLTLLTALGSFIFTPLFKWLAPGTTINRAMLMVIPGLIFTLILTWGFRLGGERKSTPAGD